MVRGKEEGKVEDRMGRTIHKNSLHGSTTVKEWFIFTISILHVTSKFKVQEANLVVMLTGQRTSPEWYSILHLQCKVAAESILHEVLMLLLVLLLQNHTHGWNCGDNRWWNKTSWLLFLTFRCRRRRYRITKPTVKHAWDTTMVVWVVAIVGTLVTTGFTKLAIAVHVLTHKLVYQTKQCSSGYCNKYLCYVLIS